MFQKGKKPPKSSDVAGSIISHATHLSIKLAKIIHVRRCNQQHLILSDVQQDATILVYYEKLPNYHKLMTLHVRVVYCQLKINS
jgi:hypothetical protein